MPTAEEIKLTPEEQAKIEKERTISDAELLKGGAEYVVDDKGEKRLEVTDGQKKHYQDKFAERAKTEKEAREGNIESFDIHARGDSPFSGSTVCFSVRTLGNGSVSAEGNGDSLEDGRLHCSACANVWKAIDILGPAKSKLINGSWQTFVFGSQEELKKKLNDIVMLDNIKVQIKNVTVPVEQED
jgi:hypothetical protein